MTGDDRKNYRSIVSGRWEKIKEDPARLFSYNNRSRQMRDEAEKPTKSEDDPSVGIMHEETVTETPVVKRTQRKPKKAPKSPEFAEMESDDSDNEERKPLVKRTQRKPKKAPKPADTDPYDSDDEEEKSCGESSKKLQPELVDT